MGVGIKFPTLIFITTRCRILPWQHRVNLGSILQVLPFAFSICLKIWDLSLWSVLLSFEVINWTSHWKHEIHYLNTFPTESSSTINFNTCRKQRKLIKWSLGSASLSNNTLIMKDQAKEKKTSSLLVTLNVTLSKWRNWIVQISMRNPHSHNMCNIQHCNINSTRITKSPPSSCIWCNFRIQTNICAPQVASGPLLYPSTIRLHFFFSFSLWTLVYLAWARPGASD